MHAKVPVADLGEEPGGPAPTDFLTKLRPEGRKKFFGDPPRPPYLRVCWMNVPPSYLEVWIRHWVLLLGTE